MTEVDVAELARLEAEAGAYEARRAAAVARGQNSDAAARDIVLNIVASRIRERWRAAGYTSATLVDGLPRPERPHAADWQGEGRARHCAVCARPGRGALGAECPGPDGYYLVREALERGVPFGLRDGLPTAGVELVEGDVRARLARATCRPVRRRKAA